MKTLTTQVHSTHVTYIPGLRNVFTIWHQPFPVVSCCPRQPFLCVQELYHNIRHTDQQPQRTSLSGSTDCSVILKCEHVYVYVCQIAKLLSVHISFCIHVSTHRHVCTWMHVGVHKHTCHLHQVSFFYTCVVHVYAAQNAEWHQQKLTNPDSVALLAKQALLRWQQWLDTWKNSTHAHTNVQYGFEMRM